MCLWYVVYLSSCTLISASHNTIYSTQEALTTKFIAIVHLTELEHMNYIGNMELFLVHSEVQ